jgi:hypothetical protein
MNRRSAIKLLAVGAACVAVPAAATWARPASLALAPWSGPPPDLHDPRMRALSYATLAPNAHNTQPWLLDLRDDAIDLYVDPNRLLPETDPLFRQTHVSQGTFVELLVLALAAQGIGADVSYFPEGEYASDRLEDRPVARVTLSTSARPAIDPLFTFITTRATNKAPYDRAGVLAPRETGAITSLSSSDASVRVVEDGGALAQLVGIAVEAMEVEARAAPRNGETAKWFRFNDAEIERSRDGFGLAQTTRNPVARWIAESFVLDRASASTPGGVFAKGAVDHTREQAESTPAFGLLETPSNSRRAQVLAGRTYAHVALTVASLGLAMHPMSQALQEYPDMSATKARFERETGLAPGWTTQMFFRLGRAKSMPHTPRRDVRALLRERKLDAAGRVVLPK